MKVYNLHCEHDHRFEGWFSSEDDFNAQSTNSLIECPVCNSNAISRLPSAPRLNLSSTQQASKVDPAEQLQARFTELVQQIVENTEDVGERFAEEARRMHYNEIPDRGIRGVATPDEREALLEEGIEVMSLPMPAALKQPLQ